MSEGMAVSESCRDERKVQMLALRAVGISLSTATRPARCNNCVQGPRLQSCFLVGVFICVPSWPIRRIPCDPDPLHSNTNLHRRAYVLSMQWLGLRRAKHVAQQAPACAECFATVVCNASCTGTALRGLKRVFLCFRRDHRGHVLTLSLATVVVVLARLRGYSAGTIVARRRRPSRQPFRSDALDNSREARLWLSMSPGTRQLALEKPLPRLVTTHCSFGQA